MVAGMKSFTVSATPSSSVLRPPSLLFSSPSFAQLRVATLPPRRPKLLKICALSSNDIKVGSNIEVDGAPWRVLEFLHVKPGKGAAFVRTKMRNYVTGNTVEKTFRAGSSIDAANIYKEAKQFTYKDGSQFVFMDLTTYEEIRLDVSDVGDTTKWLKEGMECNLLFWNGKVIDFELPITVKLKVVDCDPGGGDSSSQGGTKPATLETGAVVTVPAFVDEGNEILVDSRNRLLSALVASDDLDQVLAGLGLQPDVAVLTDLIHRLCKGGKLHKAFGVLELMSKVGCEPTIVTYNCLIKGLCYVGRVEEATEMLTTIKKRSVKPDIYTYTAVMDGLCKVGRTNEAMELLNEATTLTPTVVTFNTLLQGYCKEGRPLEGMLVLRRMKESNCSPDYITYATSLHGLLKWGRIRAAVRVHEEMEEAGFEADRRMANMLLRDLCRASCKDKKLFQDAYRVFVRMKSVTIRIETGTYCLVIQMLCARGKTDEAFLHLQEMVETGYTPGMNVFNPVMEALCLKGKVDKALGVLALMNECHRVPSNPTYNLLIAELNRQGLLLNAASIFGAALKQGQIPHCEPQC